MEATSTNNNNNIQATTATTATTPTTTASFFPRPLPRLVRNLPSHNLDDDDNNNNNTSATPSLPCGSLNPRVAIDSVHMIDHTTDALTSNNAAPSLHRENSTTRVALHIVQGGDCNNDLFSTTRTATTAIANSSGDNSNVSRSEDSAVVSQSIPTAGPVLYESIIRLSKAELRELTIANTKANLILSASIDPRNNSNTKANRTRSVRIAPCNNSNTSGSSATLTELTSVSALESTVTRKRHRTSPQQEREAKRSRHNTHGSSTHPLPISSTTAAGHDQSLADSSDMNNNNISGTDNDNDDDIRLNKMKRLEEQYSNHDKTSESENHSISSPASTSSPCLEPSPASTSPRSSASPQWGTLPHRASHLQWTPLRLWTSLPVSLSSLPRHFLLPENRLRLRTQIQNQNLFLPRLRLRRSPIRHSWFSTPRTPHLVIQMVTAIRDRSSIIPPYHHRHCGLVGKSRLRHCSRLRRSPSPGTTSLGSNCAGQLTPSFLLLISTNMTLTMSFYTRAAACPSSFPLVLQTRMKPFALLIAPMTWIALTMPITLTMTMWTWIWTWVLRTLKMSGSLFLTRTAHSGLPGTHSRSIRAEKTVCLSLDHSLGDLVS